MIEYIVHYVYYYMWPIVFLTTLLSDMSPRPRTMLNIQNNYTNIFPHSIPAEIGKIALVRELKSIQKRVEKATNRK